MPFLSSAGSNRRCVLLCARLLIQCVMGWSTPQTGIDDLMSFRFADGIGGSSMSSRRARLSIGASFVAGSMRTPWRTDSRTCPIRWITQS